MNFFHNFKFIVFCRKETNCTFQSKYKKMKLHNNSKNRKEIKCVDMPCTPTTYALLQKNYA